MSERIVDVAAKVIANAPEWIRNDLASKDPSSRARAEDALAAMIAQALNASSPQ